MSLFAQLVRVLGIGRSTTVPPFASAFAEPGPRHDDAGPSLPFVRNAFSRGLYSDEQKAAVWAKAQPIIGWDPADWRVDHLGNPLFRGHYGDSSSSFGWEVGHVVDRERGGGEELSNLRPQQCRAERPGSFRFGELLEAGPFARGL
jgi:hypothetical protein